MILKSFLDYLMPHRCLDCRDIVDFELSLCSSCWKNYTFLEDPLCRTCGRSFEIETDSDCLECIRKKPKFDISRSLFKFDDKSKKIIHNFKYHDQTYLSKFFAKLLYSKYKDIIDSADIITCVPMHKMKRLFRMYNQTQVLAVDVSMISKIKFDPGVLVKIRNTKSQTLLSRSARKENLKDSIAVNKPEKIAGKRLVLIDDVISTGETIKLCSKELKKAKAKHVAILSIAKNCR